MCKCLIVSQAEESLTVGLPTTTTTTTNAKPPTTKASKRQSKKSKTEADAEADKVIADRFRTKLCRNFEDKGSCPYESRCMFAHGERQLRTKEMNLNDGLVSEEAIRQFKKLTQQKPKKSQNHVQPVRMLEPQSFPEFWPRDPTCDPQWGLGDCSAASGPSSPNYLTSESSSDEEDAEMSRRATSVSSVIEYISPSKFRFNPYGVHFP